MTSLHCLTLASGPSSPMPRRRGRPRTPMAMRSPFTTPFSARCGVRPAEDSGRGGGHPRVAVKVPPMARLIEPPGPHKAGTETEPWYTSGLVWSPLGNHWSLVIWYVRVWSSTLNVGAEGTAFDTQLTVNVTEAAETVMVSEFLLPGTLTSYPACSVVPGVTCRLPMACGPVVKLPGQAWPAGPLHPPGLLLAV